MGDCSARVDVQFDGDGSIVFSVEVEDCEDSSGRFEFAAKIDQGDGRIQQLEKREAWSRTHNNSSANVDYRIQLSAGETLIDVDVNSSSIECYCYTD